MQNLTDTEIWDMYDSNPNLTLQKLSLISGRSVKELKDLLMGECPYVVVSSKRVES